MNWNALYILIFIILAFSMLSMLKRAHVARLIDLLHLDRGDVLICLSSLPIFGFFLYQNMSVNFFQRIGLLGFGSLANL